MPTRRYRARGRRPLAARVMQPEAVLLLRLPHVGMARTRCRLAAEGMGHDVKSTPVERLGLRTISELGIKLRDEHQSWGNGETVTPCRSAAAPKR